MDDCQWRTLHLSHTESDQLRATILPQKRAPGLAGTVVGDSPSVLGTTLLWWRRHSSSEDASTCVISDLCDLLAWRVCTGPSDSVSLSQDHGSTRNGRRRLLLADTLTLSCALSCTNGSSSSLVVPVTRRTTRRSEESSSALLA